LKIGVVLMVILLRRKHHVFVAVQKNGQTSAPCQHNKKHGRKQLHAFHQSFFDAGTSTCRRKTLSFFPDSIIAGDEGGPAAAAAVAKNDDDDGNDGDGMGRGEKKTVVGGGSCTRTRNVMCSVCAGGPCIEALAARCCRIVEGAGDGDGGAVWRRRGGRGADAGAAQLLQLHLLGGILLMASMVAGTMGSTSILGR
jgi:hypothetical protein